MVGRLTLVLALLAAASPAASQTTPREIVETTDISGLSASPDGRWIAYRIEKPSTATNRIDVDWYLVAADGRSPPRSLGRLGTAMWDDVGVVIAGEAKWTPDSRSLVVRALVEGRVGLWASATDGSGFRAVAGGDADVEAFAFRADGALITREGPSRATIARAEEAERETGILVDGATDLAQPLYHGALINGHPATQRFSGDWFDRAPLLATAPRRFFRYEAGSPEPVAADAADEALLGPQPHPALLSPTDLPAALRAALGARGMCATKSQCAPGKQRLSWLVTRSDGSAVVAFHDADFRQTLFHWSPQTSRLTKLAATDGQLSGGRTHYLPCALAQAAIFCVEAAPDIAPRLVRITEGGSKTVISSPNPDPDSEGLLAETIAWQVSGSRASGVLIRPKIPGRLPLFVTYYRCAGYLRGGVGDEWPLRALAANGIAALCINSMPSGAVGEARYVQGMEAVRAAIDLLAKRGIADPARVGMGGLSFGSEVTTWTLRHSDLLKAASLASVQLEPSYYWFNARPGRETFIENVREVWKVGSPDETPDGWKRLSAALDTSNIHAPLLMQLPEHEARLSLELFSKLATARLAEMHIFPFAAHIKAEPRQKLAAYQRNLDWFLYWLRDEIDPDPAKAGQYQRWSLLAPKNEEASTARTQRSTSAISSKRK
jgi:dipeptidyl aminopeptidase/acylaminoacyl peptidase